VDTEGDSLYSYKESVSLIQISGGGEHYIFDPLLLDTVEPLAPLFENRSILKIFHGSDYDVVSLKRDFQFKIASIFDTALAARAIGLRHFSLQHLIETYFKVKISKKFQKANWKLRPLPKDQLDYASLDTVYLIRLHQILKDEVIRKGRLDQIEEECILMEQITWNGKTFEPDDFLRIKGAGILSEQAQRVLRELAVARDHLAQKRNVPPFKVISSRHLISMAIGVPQGSAALAKLFPKKNIAVEKHCEHWLSAIKKGLETDTPLPGRIKRTHAPMASSQAPLTAAQEKTLKSLKGWRNRQAEKEELEPAMVLTGNALKEIVRRKPTTIEAFESIPMIRRWQTKRYGLFVLAELTRPTE